MNAKQRVLGMLGMAQRAGKVISGAEGVTSTLNSGKAELLLISRDISRNTLDKLLSAAEKSEKVTGKAVTCFRLGTSDDLGIALGKPARTALAVTDKAFAKGISDLLEGINEEDDI
jgi:ribosomal protein L7Ae-like RNA K-turn-binding protein